MDKCPFRVLQLAEEKHLAKVLGKLGYVEFAEVELHDLFVDAARSLAVSAGRRAVTAHGGAYVAQRKLCCRNASEYGEGDQRAEILPFHFLLILWLLSFVRVFLTF